VPLDQRARAERFLEETFKGCRDRSGCALEIAFIYTSLGEKDQAFAWDEKAYKNRDGGLIPSMDPCLLCVFVPTPDMPIWRDVLVCRVAMAKFAERAR
jgi:hypothetical protein